MLRSNRFRVFESSRHPRREGGEKILPRDAGYPSYTID